MGGRTMKIADTRAINEAIDEFVKIRKINNLVADTFTRPLSRDTFTFEEDDLKRQAKEYQDMIREHRGSEVDQDYVLMMLAQGQMLKESGAQKAGLPGYAVHELMAQSWFFHEGELEQNPYYRDIKPVEASCGRFSLRTGRLEKYQLINYNIPFVMDNGVIIPRLALIDYEFDYPCILEGEDTWMSVTPNEIFTMEQAVKEAKGNVLTLGLGLGYFAYMAALKDDVTHVTVIEREKDVIELFDRYIRPQMKCADKITVIEGDAVSYMEELEDGVYDYCFADIWISNADIDPYIKLKKICRKFRKMRISYWIEDCIASSLMGYFTMVIVEEGCKNRGVPVPGQEGMPENERRKLQFVRDLLENESAMRPDQLKWYADPRNILHMI